MPLETCRPVSVSIDSSLNEVRDLVCPPAHRVGASGVYQLLSDEGEQCRISRETILEVWEIVGA